MFIGILFTDKATYELYVSLGPRLTGPSHAELFRYKKIYIYFAAPSERDKEEKYIPYNSKS